MWFCWISRCLFCKFWNIALLYLYRLCYIFWAYHLIRLYEVTFSIWLVSFAKDILHCFGRPAPPLFYRRFTFRFFNNWLFLNFNREKRRRFDNLIFNWHNLTGTLYNGLCVFIDRNLNWRDNGFRLLYCFQISSSFGPSWSSLSTAIFSCFLFSLSWRPRLLEGLSLSFGGTVGVWLQFIALYLHR